MRNSNSFGSTGGEPFRTVLVFPPAMHPVSPPLGIASLKAYLASHAAYQPEYPHGGNAVPGDAITVGNFDLNLAYYEQAFAWLADSRLRMSIRKMDQDTTARKVAGARDFFRGSGQDSFFDLTAYNRHAGIYTGFGSVLNGLFDNFSRKILLDLPIPPLVQKFFDDLIEPVRLHRPGLIGFSILFSQQLFFALALAKLCRKAGAKIVFGGATFSVMPDPGKLLSGPVTVCVGKERGEMDAGKVIDYLIVGEGELGLKTLAEKLTAGDESPRSVPGLIRIEAGDLQSYPPEAVFDLNALPLPDFSDFSLDAYHSPLPVLPYLASRGCSWRRCAFCTHQKTYLDYRQEEPGHTAEKLEALKERYGVSHFCLVDEMVQPRRLGRISSALIGSGARLRFSAYAKPSGFSPELLERAHLAGLRLLMWGFESGSQRVLDLMRKGTKIERVGEILDTAHRAGIWNMLFVLFGFPTETKEEWQNTLDFLDSHRPAVDALSKSRFVLLGESNVFSNPAKFGITRIMDRPQRDPVSIAFDYETAEGLSQAEAAEKFEKSLPALAQLGRSPYFGQFREHMLLFAGEDGTGSEEQGAGSRA